MKGRHVVILIFVFGLSLLAILFRALEKAKPPPPPVKAPPLIEQQQPPPNPPPAFDPQTSGAIEILVRSKGAPVAGATVNLQFQDGLRSLQAVSAQDGKCRIPQAEPGQWRIYARATGVAADIKTATVETGKTAVVELDLAAGVRLEGTVRDNAGNPVQGAKVSMSLPDPAFIARTDAAGSYVIQNLPPGTYVITASSDRFRPHTKTQIELVTPGQTYREDFQLPFGSSVSGRVTDEAGQPVARATVTVSNEVPRVVRSDENGEFRADGLGEGPVTVVVVARGFATGYVRGVAAGQTDVAVRLLRGAILQGRVDGDEPSFAVHLSRYEEGLGRWMQIGSTSFGPESNGAFLMRDLSAGRYEVVIESSRRRTAAPLPVQLEAGQTKDMGPIVLTAK